LSLGAWVAFRFATDVCLVSVPWKNTASTQGDVMNISKRLDKWASAQRAKMRLLKAKFLPDNRKTLAVLAIMKNESMNIDEWIEHYIWQGVDHIFLIDNGSTDSTVLKVENSIFRDKVTLLHGPEKHQQEKHYRRAIKNERLKRRFRWLLIVDIDEFCFAKNGTNLSSELAQLDWFDVVYVQWTFFGCNPEDPHPSSLRRDLIYRHASLGSHIYTKWFAKTEYLSGGAVQVHKVRGARSARTTTANDIFQLNHYFTQSSDYWTNVKMTRGNVHSSEEDKKLSMQYFEEINRLAVVRDTSLRDLLP
jgi:hypothetical protein